MRPWLTVFLWALLLLQPGWAAMGVPEGRDGAATVSHHCPHAPCDAQASAATAGGEHADCGTCHNTCTLAVSGSRAVVAALPAAFPRPRATPPPASHPADLPERPQWAALAPA